MAELDRLKERLREIGEASRAGDAAGRDGRARGVRSASWTRPPRRPSWRTTRSRRPSSRPASGGTSRCCRPSLARVPEQASAAITRAVDAAIARSTDAVERIDASRPGGGPGNGGGGTAAPAAGSRRAADRRRRRPSRRPNPTARPTPKPKPTPQADARADGHARADDPGRRDDAEAARRTPDRTPRPTPDQGGPARASRRATDPRSAAVAARAATDRPGVSATLPRVTSGDHRIAPARRARGRTRLHRPGRTRAARPTSSDTAPPRSCSTSARARSRGSPVPSSRARSTRSSSATCIPDHFIDLVALRHYLHWEFRPARRVPGHRPGRSRGAAGRPPRRIPASRRRPWTSRTSRRASGRSAT